MNFAVSRFDWDSGNRDKCQKHGVSIAEIAALFWENRLAVRPDLAHSKTEERFLGIGRTVAGRPVFLAFAVREVAGRRLVRPISAQYMHRKEIESHEEENPKPYD
jgi:uncharacterized DUF497 family protein